MNESCDETAFACPHCATSIDSTQFSRPRRTCPDCGGELEKVAAVSWTDVARVTNLAEAGFLTDTLVGLGFDARVHQLDDFSALNDRWSSLYLIRVPAEAATEAAAQIQRYLDEDTRDNRDEHKSFRFTLSNPILNPLFWRPAALIVLTGMACFAVGQQFSGQRAERRLPADSLPSAINDIGRPFVTEPAAGEPRYRLTYDLRGQTWILDTDRDNDGRFDSRRQFHASGAAW